jgi:hypothetical protein
MEIVLSKARVEVDDVFENLINDIDIKVECFFIDKQASLRPHHDQPDPLFVEINKWRDACITEIRECKDHNLSLVDIETAQLPLEKRITRFCFLIESFKIHNSFNDFGYTLFSTDKYLTKGEITCFEALLKFMPGPKNDAYTISGKYEIAQRILSVGEIFICLGKDTIYPVSKYV